MVMSLSAAITLCFADWPVIWWFTSDPEMGNFMRLITSTVHLNDDVMISLRPGYILSETGKPSFNRMDLAQPSTSYITPYIYSLLYKFVPGNIAVLSYAGLGFLAVVGTFGLIVFTAKSMVNAILLVLTLMFTNTNLMYALNGWDHLFQGFFLTFAVVIAQKKDNSHSRLFLLSIFLSLGVLFRPDGLLIAIGIMMSLFLKSSIKRQLIIWVVVPFLCVILATLAINLYQFDMLTTTTTRLKFGSASSINYLIIYLFKNTVLNISSITLCILFLIFYFTYKKLLFCSASLPIVISCCLTIVIAAINSDVFMGGRMFWSSSCVLASTLVAFSPNVFVSKGATLIKSFELSHIYSLDKKNKLSICMRAMGILLLALMIVSVYGTILREKIRTSAIHKYASSATDKNFMIAHWIENNMRVSDGSIGIFYSGVAYHIPSFEVADLLGKADELIANLETKYGSPGHNKWDIKKTLEKWNPQAIIPSENSDITIPGVRKKAIKELQFKEGFGWFPDLLFSKEIQKNYVYCYLAGKQLDSKFDDFGFYVRKDVVVRYEDSLLCGSLKSHAIN